MNNFLYGFPLPPFFYIKYSIPDSDPIEPLHVRVLKLKEQIDRASDLVFQYQKLQCFKGPQPPVPPVESWYSFGTQEKFQEDAITLDSETLISPEQGTKDLREHFKTLYSQFIDSLLTYLDLLKNMNSDSLSEIKKFVKIYINMQHLLSSLWKRQAEEDVLDMLKDQLKRRRKCVDSMKVVLAKVKDTLEKSKQ